MQISGSVVAPLKVSLSRHQYEQLLESINSLLAPPAKLETEMPERGPLGEIEEEGEHSGVSTLHMDSTLRARMMAPGGETKTESHLLTIKGERKLAGFSLVVLYSDRF